VNTDARAVAVFALVPLALVFASGTATTFYTVVPPSLVFAEASSAAVFADAPYVLVLADARASAFFAYAPAALMLAKFVWRAMLAVSFCHLVGAFRGAGAAAVFASLLYPLVLTI